MCLSENQLLFIQILLYTAPIVIPAVLALLAYKFGQYLASRNRIKKTEP